MERLRAVARERGSQDGLYEIDRDSEFAQTVQEDVREVEERKYFSKKGLGRWLTGVTRSLTLEPNTPDRSTYSTAADDVGHLVRTAGQVLRALRGLLNLAVVGAVFSVAAYLLGFKDPKYLGCVAAFGMLFVALNAGAPSRWCRGRAYWWLQKVERDERLIDAAVDAQVRTLLAEHADARRLAASVREQVQASMLNRGAGREPRRETSKREMYDVTR